MTGAAKRASIVQRSDLAHLLDAGLPPVPELEREEAVRAAVCVLRHSRSLADAQLLLEMTGLESAPLDRCPDCGQPPVADHGRTCGQGAAARVMRLAGSIRRAS